MEKKRDGLRFNKLSMLTNVQQVCLLFDTCVILHQTVHVACLKNCGTDHHKSGCPQSKFPGMFFLNSIPICWKTNKQKIAATMVDISTTDGSKKLMGCNKAEEHDGKQNVQNSEKEEGSTRD